LGAALTKSVRARIINSRTFIPTLGYARVRGFCHPS
jgi:hypothetical protein